MLSRSIRRRQAVGSRRVTLGKRSRSASRYGSYPMSSVLSRPMTRGAYRGSRGIAGSTRYLYARPGRDLPLYVPKQRMQPDEMHHLDRLDLPFQPWLANGTIYHVNSIAQGTALTDRLASRATCLSLQLRGSAQAMNAGFTYSAMVLVVDRSPTGVLPAITDIFDSDDSFSFQRVDNRDRFTILYRRDFSLEGSITAGGLTSTTNVPINTVIRFRVLTSYAANTGAISDVKSNAIYLLTLGDRATLTAAPLFTVFMRLGFQA